MRWHYVLIDEDGKNHETNNLRQWCRDRGLWPNLLVEASEADEYYHGLKLIDKIPLYGDGKRKRVYAPSPRSVLTAKQRHMIAQIRDEFHECIRTYSGLYQK